MVDCDGVIHYSPNVPAFLKAPVRARLEESVGLPTVVDNDANVAVVAELTHGAARGRTRGAARHAGHRRRWRSRHRRPGAARCARLRRGDRALPGRSRRPAAARAAQPRALGGARLGHRAGRAGARPGRRRRAAVGAGDRWAATRPTSGARTWATPPPTATPTRWRWSRSTRQRVALGLVGLVNILDPELVVVSGGLVELDDVLLGPLRARVRRAHRGRPVPSRGADRRRRARRPGRRRRRRGAGAGAAVSMPVKVGITLPSFRDEVGPSLAIAAAAEASGLDGVFAYDHLFRRDTQGNLRPALEMFALMGAVAGATTRVAVGSLVARATLRPHATLANGFDSLARILGPDRLLVGDRRGRRREPRGERDLRARVRHRRRAGRRRCATRSTRYATAATRSGSVARIPRCARSRPRTPTAGTGGAGGSSGSASRARTCRRRRPARPFTLSWGGLVVLADDDDAAAAKARTAGCGRPRVASAAPISWPPRCGRTSTPEPSG